MKSFYLYRYKPKKEEYIINSACILSIASVLLALTAIVSASEETSTVSSDQALQMLVDGNERFVSGNATHPNQSSERLAEVVSGQHPFAIVVGCSDSRVPPEIVFDQGVGDLFVIRTAGQVLDDVAIASIEYAVEHLSVPLVVVLGHDSCGAVTAVVAGGEVPGHLGSLVEAIEPAVEEARDTVGEDQLLNQSIDNNILNIVEQISTSEPVLAEYVADGRLQVVGARYHLESGEVEFYE
jgi:carbonic anhydrase